MKREAERTIEAAREGFDKRLHTDEYKRIHSDAEQLDALIGLFDIKTGKAYLDIGTGNGYVAFELARREPGVRVFGLDVAADSIAADSALGVERRIPNIRFDSYDGHRFPYEDASIFGSSCRYAFHHFPDIGESLRELSRITEPSGFFVLSDPSSAEADAACFIDAFQSLLPDGHQHFYRRSEIESAFREYGFVAERSFDSRVRYPRKVDSRYLSLLAKTNQAKKDLYRVELLGDEVFVSVEVMNILFRFEGPSS